MKIEAGKRYVRRDGNISGPMKRRNSERYPWLDWDSDAVYTKEGKYRADGEITDFDLIALYEDEPKQEEAQMKFKVGDRVKYFSDSVLGEVKEVNPTSNFPFIVNWEDGSYGSYSNTARLELIQPEPQEPLPGKFYRTRDGDKVFYVGKSKNDYFIYQEADGEYEEYAHPFKYLFDADDTSCMDIVGEWTEETKLPSLEIKRWAVVFAKDAKEGKRGESLSIHTNVNSAHIFLNKLGEDMFDCEIVELTGTLPERKQ